MCSTTSGCGTSASAISIGRCEMPGTEEILRPFVAETRHLTSALNIIASDMIRDRTLAKKLDDDPDSSRKTCPISEDELEAMRGRNLIRLYERGLPPFLLVR